VTCQVAANHAVVNWFNFIGKPLFDSSNQNYGIESVNPRQYSQSISHNPQLCQRNTAQLSFRDKDKESMSGLKSGEDHIKLAEKA
jgi:hypothetical protein